MSTAVWRREPSAAGARAGAGARRAGGSWARGPGRTPLVLLATLAVMVALVAALVAGQQRARGNQTPLDPDNPRGNGTRALAQVLRQHGVAVDVARDQRALLSLPAPTARTTVVVARPDELTPSTLRRAREHAAAAGQVVLLEPGWPELSGWGVPVQAQAAPRPDRPVGDEYLSAGCSTPGIAADDRITPADRGFGLRRGAPGTACFTGASPSEATASQPSYALVVVDGAPRTVVLGAASMLTNREISRLDNAGVALRLLGQGDRVIWYDPDPYDAPYDEDVADAGPQAPPWVGPGLLLGLLALLAAMLWRGRRLGRLVVEPLPAVVKAIETTQSRGRLYQRAGDTDRSAQVLRAATLRRLSGVLGLPPSTVDEAAPAIAAASRRPVEEIRRILGADPGEPHLTEAALLRLGQDLSTLEKEVRGA